MKKIFIFVVFFFLLVACKEKDVTTPIPATPIPNITEDTRPAFSFILNVHDWYNPEESAETLTHLLDIFEKYNIKAEFYFTEPIFKTYEQYHPEVLQRLLEDNMTISFHIRQPHPVIFGSSQYSAAIENMSSSERIAKLTDYEIYALNLSTGGIDYTHPGGYSYIKEKIGYAPIVAGLNADSPTLRKDELKVLKSMGLQMYIREHMGDTLDTGDSGLLTRPSQFGIEEQDQKYNYFVNGQSLGPVDPLHSVVDPSELFAGAQGYGLFVAHENDFYTESPGWTQVYWRNLQGDHYIVKPSPYDLTASDGNLRFFTEEEMNQQWENYEAIVAYASEHFRIVTSRDIIAEYNANK
ncbi:MAG: hypothetical protein WC254_06310 [Candidatus Woesearchaeota archaeon]|jgi:peptidoglycan/xylan/chitin deacetylase (PgdA/CDA1 family)